MTQLPADVAEFLRDVAAIENASCEWWPHETCLMSEPTCGTCSRSKEAKEILAKYTQ